MPIPNFDHNHVIPPHIGDPRLRTDVSPFECTTLELCQKFSTSAERIIILKNFLQFRNVMHSCGVTTGFQWLDGSFLENIEISELRSPRDLDVVTFFGGLTILEQKGIKLIFPEFGSPSLSKNNFLLDHYAVDYCYDPNVTVEQTRYWLQLFTHKRNGIWKGMLKVQLNTLKDDEDALNYLHSIKL